MRRLEIIGEAVKNTSEDIREENQDIPWRKIAGMRDIIIHEYFGVTMNMIWVVAQKDLPDLKPKIERILRGLQ